MFSNDTDYFDQHFLIDKEVIDLFIDKCDFKKNDIVLEVGPGKGTLTKKIYPLVKELIVVEKDNRLIPYLKEIKDIKIINDSILDIELPKVNKIVTSLPYSITEPFIYKLIDIKFDKLVMLCGKNYIDHVYDNDSKLGILTNLYFDVKRIKDIAPDSFDPKPRVMSSLVEFTIKDEKELNKNELILKYLYKYRYMKTKNALKEILIKLDSITQKEARNIIDKYNIDDTILNKLFDELSNEEVIYLKDSLNK